MDCAERIFELLKEQHMGQKDFAVAIGISPQKVSEWKLGKAKSYTKYIPQIAKALGTTAEYLITGNGAKYDTSENTAPESKDNCTQNIDEITREIKERSLDIKIAVESTYRFYLSLKNLVGATTPVPHDILFNSEKTESVEAEIFQLIDNFMKTASPEERANFQLRLDEVGREYYRNIKNREETSYPTSEEMDAYLEMLLGGITEQDSEE